MVYFLKPAASRFLGAYRRKYGIRRTVTAIARHLDPGSLIEDYFVLKGIYSRRLAYRGPLFVQVDLTDNCNNNCVCCWCNSPLRRENAEPDHKRASLEFSRLKKTIDELTRLGTREITLSGGGEPFMYPFLFEVVEYIKKKKIRCQLFTNFTLANRQSLRQLADSNLDSLVVSVWAATAKTYALLHPNKTERQFEEIKENLMYLSEIKKKPDRPSLCIHNVINAMNCREFRQMGDFACEVGANEISFSVLDSVPPVIDPLLLTAEQRNSILSDCRRLTGRIPIRDIDEFTRRLSSKGAACGEYDRDAVEQFPCYAGWLSSRIKSDGEVNPCLKSHRIPMGNIYRQSFQEIWNSFAQQEFRMRSLSFTKSAPYFFKVGNNGRDTPGCYRVCDDLVRNSSLYRRIALSPITRVLIKTAGLEEGLVRLFRKMSRLARIVQLVFIVVVYSIGLKFYRLVKKMTVFPGE